VLLHGTLHQLYCGRCKTRRSIQHPDDTGVFSEGQAPTCVTCSTNNEARAGQGFRQVAVGCLRPNVVLYNESHPNGDDIAKLAAKDVRSKPDLVIVMGTSLKVDGCRRLVRDLVRYFCVFLFSTNYHQTRLDRRISPTAWSCTSTTPRQPRRSGPISSTTTSKETLTRLSASCARPCRSSSASPRT